MITKIVRQPIDGGNFFFEFNFNRGWPLLLYLQFFKKIFLFNPRLDFRRVEKPNVIISQKQ